MISDASSSNPPPLPSELLAPGFRFHPTDEELVSYYLKRKVSGRPLRVDAIAEVDLYKAEPWDLPAMSRLRSRDMEWYFFSPLDRKYANRSRTNRATAQGYWKTTGKDRPVVHGARTVGMKKTLVFHVGRAPRGERTDWVMHEYRLEDEELARAGIPQDAYVVCRIFQKSGPGPQNGAQYGGMFMEEEWEEADDLVLAVEGCTTVTGSGAEEYLQMTDFAHSQEHDNQHEHNHLLTAIRDGQNPEDPFLLEMFQDQNFIDMNASGLQDSPTFHDGMGGNSGLTTLPFSPVSENDGYMELNDIVNAVTVEYPSSEDSADCFLGTSNGQISMNRGDESNKLPEVHEVEEFFDTLNENTDSPLFQIWPAVRDGIFLEPNDLMYPTAGDYPSDQTAEDNMLFYDAPSNDLPFAQDNFVQMNDLLYSPTADSSGFNLVDDIMAYFDSTENNLHYSDSAEKQEPVDSSVLNESNFALEVGGSSVPAYETKHQPSEVNPGTGASSLVRLLEADNQSNGINEEVNVAPDSEKEKDHGRTLTRRLANMLGSISAPPAHASEYPTAPSKSSGQISATTSGGSIHFTTGMIQIQSFQVMGRAEHWSLHKNVDVGFHLSYGMASGGAVSKPGGFVPVTKMQGWSMSVVLRGGFYLFLLSALFLAVGFKVGMCVCKS